jgi:cell division septation protein DedD
VRVLRRDEDVPETARPAADDGFHEIQLTGKQLVFLFMATTVVAVVIFLCGVLVGRGVRAERTAEATVATENATPPSDAAGAPAATGTVSDRPTSNEDLSYAKRLQGDSPADEQLKKPESTELPPTPAESAPETPAASTPAQPPATANAAPAPHPGSGWMVQIAALRDRGAADQIVKRLGTKGYPAFIVEPQRGAPALGFRVRVGPYSDRREAEKVSRRLEREEQFKPFITR